MIEDSEMREITVSEIRSLVPDVIFARGRTYFYDGNVKEIHVHDNEITAKVEGTAPEPYTVQIEVLTESLTAFCSCPYQKEHPGECKHIVAALLVHREKPELQIQQESSKQMHDDLFATKLEQALEKTELTPLRSFIKDELTHDPSLQNRFFAFFGAYAPKTIQEYKTQMEENIKKTVQSSEENALAPFEDQAAIYAKQANMTEAAKIYRALIETGVHYLVEAEEVEDEGEEDEDWNDGEEEDDEEQDEKTGGSEQFYSICERAGKNLAQCVKHESFDATSRKEHISALFEMALNKKHWFYQQLMLLEIIENMWSTLEDLDHIRTLIEPHLTVALITPTGDEFNDELAQHDAKDMADRFIHAYALILNHITDINPRGRKQETYRFLSKHKEDYSLLLMLVERLTRDGRTAQAVRLARQALRQHEDHTEELRLILDHLYAEMGDAAGRLENVMSLFLEEPSIAYYRKMKKLCPQNQWSNFFTEAIEKLGAKPEHPRDPSDRWQGIPVRDRVLIDVLIAEGQYDCAVKKVFSRNRLDMLGSYRSALAGKFPKEYAEKYWRLIETFVNTNSARHSTYEQVVSYLKEMSEIPSQLETTRKLRDKLCADHPTWHAFQEMLGKAPAKIPM